MNERIWADRKDDDLRHSDQAWMNDKSWLENDPINRNRIMKYPQYRESEYFESGHLSLIARHPLISSFIVMLLGGLCFLIFTLIYF
jgi:hypothetical protein